MLTFRNIQDQVLTYLDQQGDAGHGLDVVKFAIQSAHEKRLMADRWSFMLWPTPVKLPFKAGQRVYQLHQLAAMLSDFTNPSNNTSNVSSPTVMRETPTRARWKLGVQADRFHFEFVADAPVQQQPVAGVVTVTGKARLTYTDANGTLYTEDITNSTTSVAATEIVKVTKLDDLALTLKDVSNNTLLSLLACEFGKSYPQIRLFDDGIGGEVGTYRFYKRPTMLVNDRDIPDIPYPFSRVLVFDALLELATYNDSQTPSYWLKQQADWDLQLRQTYQEGEMEGSETRQIVENDTYGG